jgi:hypothetical protein
VASGATTVAAVGAADYLAPDVALKRELAELAMPAAKRCKVDTTGSDAEATPEPTTAGGAAGAAAGSVAPASAAALNVAWWEMMQD